MSSTSPSQPQSGSASESVNQGTPQPLSLRLTVPGKSFLAGEYLAIKGGPALVFASSPRFELLAAAGSGQLLGMHPSSPAGQLVADNFEYFRKYDLQFVDPHQGKGGWGASTAQFLAVFVMNEWRDSLQLETLKSLSISRLLDSYWKYAWNGEGARPSGADLVAQYKGALTHFERNSGLISVFKWPFAEIDFALIATGHKIPTHEHLKTLPSFEGNALEGAMTIIRQSLQASDAAQFVTGIQSAGKALKDLSFVAANTQSLLTKFLQVPGVLAAKGCGALGADVVMVVFEKARRSSIDMAVQSLGLKMTATSADMSRGFDIEVRNA